LIKGFTAAYLVIMLQLKSPALYEISRISYAGKPERKPDLEHLSCKTTIPTRHKFMVFGRKLQILILSLIVTVFNPA